MIYGTDLTETRHSKEISFYCPRCDEKTTMDKSLFIMRFGSPRFLARSGEYETCQCCREDLCVEHFKQEP